MFTQKKLENGLQVVTSSSDSTKTVTLLILVGAGSRYETDAERGIAHFQEHMFFKGGDKYQTAKAVAEAIDGVGGDFNAFTGKEYVGYYVKVASEKKEFAFDVLSDMLLHAKFPQEEIEKERGVILEEMNMYEDMPIYKIGWDFEELMFGEHPMAKDQIGTVELIKTVNQEDFQNYKDKLYTPDNIVITATGNISADETLELTKKYFDFSDKPQAQTRFAEKFSWDGFGENGNSRVFIRNKKTEQAQVVIGYPSFDRSNKKTEAVKLLSIILGGNMSSRMFSSVREEKGLCYSIGSSLDSYTDCALFSTRAGVTIERTKEAIEAIKEEYLKIATEAGRPTEEELERAKNYYKGKLTLRMEDSESVANFYGTQFVLKDKIVTLEEYFKILDNITVEEVFEVAKELFIAEKISMALIGPFEGKKKGLEKTLVS